MSQKIVAAMATGLFAAALATSAPAQAPQAPVYATTKVEGTDNVYIFRYANHQSMFIVTKAGVIATDPISLRRPAAKTYIEEIRKINSHAHYDHIAGGKPFKDLGATFIAHKNAKARIVELKPDDVVVPDQVVDKKTISLGGTTLELIYVGKNHSDSTLVMRLPKEKIIFTVDWIPLGAVQFREMADTYIPDIEEGLKKVIAMDWDKLIAGHPGPVLTVSTQSIPWIKDAERLTIEQIAPNFWRADARYGFMEHPDIPVLLQAASNRGCAIDLSDVTYYVGHETVVHREDGKALPRWQEVLFSLMERNAAHVTDFFRLPPNLSLKSVGKSRSNDFGACPLLTQSGHPTPVD